jgi:phosphoenolpyruvate carboxykinase (GTP)
MLCCPGLRLTALGLQPFHSLGLQRAAVYRINRRLVEWADEVASKTRPDRVFWCDGTDREYWSLINQMVKDGSLIELDQMKYPGCYLYRSKPFDVARTEASTFICTPNKDEAGPTNNWMNDKEAEQKLWGIFDRSMEGRTMYVVPYLMGPIESPYSQAGVEITDSSYVVISLRIMTRMGSVALERLKGSGDFVKGIHSMGTMNPERRYICHFPYSRLIMSINSNYGGNALLSKKCHSLRIASLMARDEGWLAEHMLIVGIDDPSGKPTYVTGAFPSASGKTNLAMLRPPRGMERFRVLTVGDDIAWMHLGPDGMMRAINPEAGFFCVAPNSSPVTNPNLLETISKNTIFTNVALTAGQTPWWEGCLPSSSPIVDWQGKPWTPGSGPAAHPNSRFTAPISQYPLLSPRANDPTGVPISAMLFGGRRAKLIPLVYETFSWEHGVLAGAMMKVETTAAAEGAVGMLRNDPMAMMPFCGYNMADYFNHWLSFASKSQNLPRIFVVNWFRTGSDGKFLWPGYGQNLRVLKWVVDRINGKANAMETPIGYIPAPGSFDLDGLNLPKETMEELFRIDGHGWLEELKSSEEFFKTLGDRFPERLWQEHRSLLGRLRAQHVV